MTVEALPRLQQPPTYIGPEETTWRNRAFQIATHFGILLGAGLFLASFYTAIPWFVGVGVTVLSLFALHYIRTASSNLVEHAEKGDQCMVKFLLFLGANPNFQNQSGVDRCLSRLFCAIRSQQKNIVELLLKYGANPLLEINGVSRVQTARVWRDRFANPEFDNIERDDTRPREERKSEVEQIAAMLEAQIQRGVER